MQEHHLTVARTARYFTLGVPNASLRQVWFVCHGYGQLAGKFIRHFAAMDDGSRLIVAPEGLSRFYLGEATGGASADRKIGASWMTREDRLSEIDDYVRYLDGLYAEVFRQAERSAMKVFALGFSQGAAAVSRWVSLGRARVDDLVLWGGELPPDLDLAAAAERLRAVRLSIVCGRRDEFITPKVIATAEARLRAHGVSYQVIPFDGGHEMNDGALKQLLGE